MAKVNIRPLNDKIVVKRLEAEQKTAGGIVLPDTAKEKPKEGVVVSLGNGRLLESGDRVADLDDATRRLTKGYPMDQRFMKLGAAAAALLLALVAVPAVATAQVVDGQVSPGMLSWPWNRRGKRWNSLSQSSLPRSTTMARAVSDMMTCGTAKAEAPRTRTA